MKSFVILAFLAFFASASLAQDQNQPLQPQSPPQGWYQQNISSSNITPRFSFINRDTGWAGSLYTSDSGYHWTRYQNGRYILQFVDTLHGWSVSGNGTNWISRTTDGGTTWMDFNTGIGAVSNLFFCTPSRGFFSNGNHIASTIDSGKTWKLDTTYVGDLGAFACFDSVHVIAAGRNYPNPDPPNNNGILGIFYTSDGGNSWKFSTKERFVNGGCNGIAVLDSQTVLIIGDVIESFRSTD